MIQLTEETTIQLDPKKVHVSTLNTRQPTVADVSELMESIRHSGQITPAIVRPHKKKEGHYELAAGARRKMACGALGITLCAIVRDIPDAEFEDMILTDNLQHEDPDPMQEAILIERRIAAGAHPSEIASRYGKSDSWLRRRIKLTGLNTAAREAWQQDGAFAHFNTEMMEFIGTLPAEEQDSLADDPWRMRDFSSLKDLLENHHHRARSLENADWLQDPCTFVEGCGPGCANNSADTLFPDEKHPCGSCLNAECFLKRHALFLDQAIATTIGERALADFVIFSGNHQRQIMWRGTVYQAFPSWEQKQAFRMLKKERKGAMPALDLADPVQPVIRWVIAKVGEAIPAATATTAKKESREDRLTSRRLALINQQLVNAVKEAAIPTHVSMLRIVAAFGTNQSRNTVHHLSFNHTWEALDSENLVPGLDDYKETKVSPEQAVWDSVCHVITSRLAFHKNRELLDDERRSDMERIAALIGFDHAQTWETICTKELPIPKSWGPGFDPMTLTHAGIGTKAKAA